MSSGGTKAEAGLAGRDLDAAQEGDVEAVERLLLDFCRYEPVAVRRLQSELENFDSSWNDALPGYAEEQKVELEAEITARRFVLSQMERLLSALEDGAIPNLNDLFSLRRGRGKRVRVTARRKDRHRAFVTHQLELDGHSRSAAIVRAAAILGCEPRTIQSALRRQIDRYEVGLFAVLSQAERRLLRSKIDNF